MFRKINFLAPVKSDAHKYSRGIVGVLAGSEKYPGAAVLCVGGARRGGAGYVKFLSQSKVATDLIYSQFPDVVHIKSLKDEKLDAFIVGPGAPKLVTIPKNIPLVLDSAAIVAVDSKRNPITVLTPHEGELKYLGYELGDRAKTAQKIADDLKVIVLLKGARTIVAAPDSPILVDTLGGPELATAGSGDILAGLIGSALASWKPQNIYDAQRVVYRTVEFHSSAGKIARKSHNPVVATDLLEAIAQVNL